MDAAPFGVALWLGVLTSISPCPLATNVLAISFIGKQVDSTRRVVLSGICYTLGRMLAYGVLAVVVVAGLLSIPGISNFLQRYMNLFLGPVLILAGMGVAGLLGFPSARTATGGERVRGLAERGGFLGAGLLGMLFALAFCPVSAALFFGALIPICVQQNSRLLAPALYGVGTAVPVLGFAFALALGARRVSALFDRVSQVERWARWLTGGLFIAVGVYLSLKYIFGVFGG
jgi:cytochrome c-type biogenesis protein